MKGGFDMNSFMLTIIVFLSFLSGFFVVFGLLGSHFKLLDDIYETRYAPIRPGVFRKKEDVKTTLKRQYGISDSDDNDCYFDDENTESDIVSEEVEDAKENYSEVTSENSGGFLQSRMPSKELSYTEFMSNLKEESSFEECMKDNISNENNAYKILKRKKESQQEIMKQEEKDNVQNPKENV